jgi:hypothetical protein
LRSEVKITQDAKDERCIGVIAIRLMSPQGMMEEEQLKKLQKLVQTAIYTQPFLDIEPTDLPKYVSAFSFEINPVHPIFFYVSKNTGVLRNLP